MRSPPPIPEALLRALQRAGAFVEAHGTTLDAARHLALRDADGRDRVVALLLESRGSDGGFAPRGLRGTAMIHGSTLAGTAAALDVFDELGLRRGPLLEGAVAWLARAQGEDGSWDAAPESLAGDAARRTDDDAVFWSGLIAGHLAKLSYGSPSLLARAEEYLDARFSPERVEDERGRGLLAYAHACTNGHFERADEMLQWCGRALEKGFRGGWLGPVAVARTLLLCDTPALPGGRVSASEVVLALLAAQQRDGSFDDRGGKGRERVEATLVGARALVRFGAAR